MGMLPARLYGLILATCVLSGCAHSYADADGNRHIIGLVNLTISPATSEPAAADWVRMRNVGIAISRSEFASSLDIGYSDNMTAVIRNHSCAYIGILPTAVLTSTGENHASTLAK